MGIYLQALPQIHRGQLGGGRQELGKRAQYQIGEEPIDAQKNKKKRNIKRNEAKELLGRSTGNAEDYDMANNDRQNT